MTIDGLALQELREIIESIAEQSDGDWLGAADARLILALMDERDARIDAEGAGLPWVSVDVRRPTLADADSTGRVLWSGPGMPTNCALFRLEMSAYTHWLPPSAIPVPGQSGAPEPAAQPEARTDREFACDKCGASAWLPAGTVRCGAPECGVRALTTTENER